MGIEKFRRRVVAPAFKGRNIDASILCDLGTPVVADVDRIVTTANMIVGAYTIAAQPDVPRCITATRTVVGDADTPGTLVIVGTNWDDQVITETLTVGAHTVLVVGTKAFKTVTSVTGVGWVIATNNDTITVGVGAVLGLPFKPDAVADVMLGVLGVTVTAHNAAAAGTLEGSTVDMSAGTYDGSKRALVFTRL
jgi:hypothetical protein